MYQAGLEFTKHYASQSYSFEIFCCSDEMRKVVNTGSPPLPAIAPSPPSLLCGLGLSRSTLLSQRPEAQCLFWALHPSSSWGPGSPALFSPFYLCPNAPASCCQADEPSTLLAFLSFVPGPEVRLKRRHAGCRGPAGPQQTAHRPHQPAHPTGKGSPVCGCRVLYRNARW